MKSPTMEGVESDREGDSCEASGPPSPMAPAQRRGYWASLLGDSSACETLSKAARALAEQLDWSRTLAPLVQEVNRALESATDDPAAPAAANTPAAAVIGECAACSHGAASPGAR